MSGELIFRGGIEATRDVNALELLPEKLKAEISILVHSKALQKVRILSVCMCSLRTQAAFQLAINTPLNACTFAAERNCDTIL